jgi:pyruvate,water dikinase
MLKFLDLFRKSKAGTRISADKGIFQHKYESFKSILAGNNRALEIITDLEQTFYEDKPFTMAYVLAQSEILIGEVYNLAEDLNALSEGKYPGLFESAERIGVAILNELERKKKIVITDLVLPLKKLGRERVSEVGGKAANLGEVFNRVGLPVPQGFAITAYACQYFMEYNKFPDLIESKLKGLDVNDTENLVRVSEEVQALIFRSVLPPDLEKAILQAAEELRQSVGPDVRLAVRSSATTEDSEASFAGQHSTVLNVTPENVIDAYKEVVASTFNPRATFYRRSKGYLDQDVIMSTACITMVDAKTSGVMYTVDPNDSSHAAIMISAVWGLGVSAVDGSVATDFYQIDRKDGRLEVLEVARKETFLRSDIMHGLTEEPVPEELKTKPCLNQAQIEVLVDYGLKLEKHYGVPLDIEWAIDQEDKLYILQARPLKFAGEAVSQPVEGLEKEFANYPILLKGGASASDGVASGLAYVITSDHNLLNIPEGSILIAPQTSPRYVSIIGRVQAIVTDVGSVTGHMASVAREFRIPTLVGTGTASATIPHGEEITVDVRNRVVYRGRVEPLLKEKKKINPMKGSPTYKYMQSALQKIAPLNLIDPKQDNFKPEGCQTIHDIIRFAHEMSMQEMFRMSDDLAAEENIAVRFRSSLPLNIYIVDLGGGLSADPAAREVKDEDVTSVPFKALLKGMTHKDVQWLGSTRMDWRGFGSILAESVFRDPQKGGEMGGPSYALISSNYLNFSSRLGYHFVTVDTYCGPTINDNYITFYFKGGAADIQRRSRRALLLASILKKLRFKVEHKGDMVKCELKKYDQDIIQDKLDMLGRLLGAIRLLDMVLSDDGQIDWYVNEFFKDNYTFQTPISPQPRQ